MRAAAELDPSLPRQPRKGRGAVGNPAPRFDREVRVIEDDGWGSAAEEALAPPRLETTVTADASRTVIARNDSPDLPFDRSINPYRGCEHGCVYCFARPSHAYLGLSPGLDFETKLVAKHEVAALLDKELRRKGYDPAPIALGTNTDPYQPIERELRLTRATLEVLRDWRHPVSIVTKSALVARDADILAEMGRAGLAKVFLSVASLDAGLARKLEPRAATPSRRIETIRALSAAGVPTGVILGPVIPGLTDLEIERVLEAAAAAGACYAGWVLLRLPHEVRELMADWLAAHAPGKAGRVLSLIKETRGGRLNDPQFGSRQRGQGPYAELIAARFDRAAKRLGLADRSRWRLDSSQVRPPARPGDQLSLGLS